MEKRKQLRVALLGFGTVGSSVVSILMDSPVASDISLTRIFNRNVERKRAAWVPNFVVWTESIEEVFASKPDVIIELTGAYNDAANWICEALANGIHVITANKALLADSGPTLFGLAEQHNSHLLFEAAVGGGIPVIRGIREGLAGDKIIKVVGILNGTCNYILSKMAEFRQPMDVVLSEAQRLGFAEADPTADLDGHDAAAKIVILAGISFQRYLSRTQVQCRSIRPIMAIDFDYARELGCTIRQISMAEISEDGLYATVGPALVPLASDFGRNNGANNLISVVGAYNKKTNFSGAGAGGHQTAVAVMSDLLALARNSKTGRTEKWLPVKNVSLPPQPYYLRFVVKDQPGIIAAIASALSRQSINLEAVIQLPGYPKDRLPFAITLEECEENALMVAMIDISSESFHEEAPLVLPIYNKLQ